MEGFFQNFGAGFEALISWGHAVHLLFVLALIVAYTFFTAKKLFKLLLSFAIGHIITIILGVYEVIGLKNQFIEIVMYLSVGIICIINFASPKKTRGYPNFLLIFTLFFGLVHGFSLAETFIQRTTPGATFFSLLEFILGIEFAQLVLAVVLLILAFLYQSALNKSKRDWVLVISAIILGVILPELVDSLSILISE